MISFANGRHWPQRGLRSIARNTVRVQAAPSRAALRTSHSRIALQTQTIMQIDLLDNANHSQLFKSSPERGGGPREALWRGGQRGEPLRQRYALPPPRPGEERRCRAAIRAMGMPTSAM